MNAIQKYGWDNMIFEVVEESDKWTKEILDEREIYWIQLFDSINFGYNLTPGGDGVDSKTARVLAKRHHDNMSFDKKEQRSNNCSKGQLKRFKNFPETTDTKIKKKKAHQGNYKIISPCGVEFITTEGLKEFAIQVEMLYNVTYWQLYDAYRRSYNGIIISKKRKDSNNWKVFRLDEPNSTRSSKRMDIKKEN